LYFKNLPWAENCPLGFANYIIKNGDYAEEWGTIFTIKESTANDICYILKTLYQKRNDFRNEIMGLNGSILYKGRKGSFIGGTGDNEIGWHADDSPPCILHITKLNENEINVYIGNE
jgi:hypothetical protein